MKMSYLAHEVELSKRHEKILGQRTALLQQMEQQLDSQTKKKKLQAVKFESANERNALLLKDLEAAEDSLRVGLHMQPHPTVIALETTYWASIEEQLPKWEQFLLGRTRNPVEGRSPRAKKSQNQLLQDKDTFKNTNSQSPTSKFKTPPRCPPARKQK
ncbi:centrosomal protein 15 [Rhinoraja longicauda]